MRWSAILGLILVEIIYLIVGGLVFWELESKPIVTTSTPTNLSEIVDDILANYTCLSKDDLLSIIRTLQANITAAQDTPPKSWTFPASLFFAMTIVTSIGYGNIVPSTGSSRAFCCVYALIGIPLTLVMLYGVGERLNSIAKRLDKRILHRNPRVGKVSRSIVIFIPGFVMFLLIPSVAFWQLEAWNYENSLYYSLITLTTIGFGDLVAGVGCNQDETSCHIYRISVGIWIFLGLAWLAGLISSVQDSFLAVVEKVDTRVVDERRKHKQKSEISQPSESNSDDSVSDEFRLKQKASDETPVTTQVQDIEAEPSNNASHTEDALAIF